MPDTVLPVYLVFPIRTRILGPSIRQKHPVHARICQKYGPYIPVYQYIFQKTLVNNCIIKQGQIFLFIPHILSQSLLTTILNELVLFKG
jgi:hypothetical protein